MPDASDFFFFTYPGQASDVVVFTSSAQIDVAALNQPLREYLSEHLPPERLLLLGSGAHPERVVVAAGDPDLEALLQGATRWPPGERIVPLAFTERGEIENLARKGSAPPPDLVQAGLHALFRRHGALLNAGPGFHWVNPSGVHTDRFIRAGQLLKHSAEVSFVAMPLLGYWRPGLCRLVVDSASISSVAYALAHLRRAFAPDEPSPSIDSFSSYQGLRSFRFEPNTLCLISASISGGLEDKIVERSLKRAEVVTLFYGGRETAGRQILCDLVDRGDGGVLAEPIASHSEADCPHCRDGVATVRFSGDDFVPANPKVEDRLLKLEDAPSWLDGFLGQLVGRRLARCHCVPHGDAAPAEIYLHADGDRSRPFFEAFERELIAAVPASLVAIVHGIDPFSMALAQAVRKHWERATGKTLDDSAILTTETPSLRDSLPDPGGAVVVVTSVATGGRSLLRTSLALRGAKGAQGIVYLIGISRMASESDRNWIRSNLGMGTRPDERRVVEVVRGYLPEKHASPWAREVRLLEDMLDAGREAEDLIAARLRRLSEAEGYDEGLIDDVFLPRVNGEPLKLREGFTFWRQLPKPQFAAGTQADVYLTISALLHAIRTGKAGQPMVQHEHNRTVLAVGNFRRFNDGVIQAAFLRAARPGELNYADHDLMSSAMLDLIQSFVAAAQDDEGEAAPEFLLAVALGHLRLTPGHVRDLIETLKSLTLSPLLAAFEAPISLQA